MSLQDPIADMLTRIRNAVRNKSAQVTVLKNGVCLGIARVLKDEGYVNSFDTIDDGRQGLIRIQLKYGPRGENLINGIKRVSRVGARVHKPVDRLPRVLDGLGIAIVSTSKGIISDRQARKENVGGELLCTVE